MSAQNQIEEKTAAWLLEDCDPGVRYLALRDVLSLPTDDPDLRQAAKTAHTKGPIRTYLDAMAPEDYWSEPGPGYLPKYFSTVWALIALAQLGAAARYDERITAPAAIFATMP